MMYSKQSYLLFTLQLIAHVLSIYGFFILNWYQYLIALLIYFLMIVIGMTVTYHRLLAHRSWKSPNWFKRLGLFFGGLSLTGSALAWVAIHREHHHHSDTELDPHSPKHKGKIFVQWFSMFAMPKLKYVKDLLTDRDIIIQHQIYFYFHILLAILLLLSLSLDWAIALYFLPAAVTWNMGSFINVFGHKHGEPVNNKILAFLVGGEGNHKNHHLNPKKYQFGHGIWDLGGLIIERVQIK